jgi:molybdopterin converting factor small subunit
MAAVNVEARDIRELFEKLEAEHPGLKPQMERGIAVSINGRIYRDSWFEKIPENAEVYLLPRIAGG